MRQSPPTSPRGFSGRGDPHGAAAGRKSSPSALNRPVAAPRGLVAGWAPLPYFFCFLILVLIVNHQECRGLDGTFSSFPGLTKNILGIWLRNGHKNYKGQHVILDEEPWRKSCRGGKHRQGWVRAERRVGD